MPNTPDHRACVVCRNPIPAGEGAIRRGISFLHVACANKAEKKSRRLGGALPIADKQSGDTSTPPGRALFQMLGVFAEFERAMIIERVRVGLKRAKAEGKTLGRPKIREDVVEPSAEAGPRPLRSQDRHDGQESRDREARQHRHGDAGEAATA